MPSVKGKSGETIVLDREVGRVGGARANLFVPSIPGEQFRIDNIPISTYRKMRDDYQISACLNVLAFTLQKIDWYFEGGDERTREAAEATMSRIWTQLVKTLAKGFWAGYSAAEKRWNRDAKTGWIIIDKIRDFAPESARVLVDEKGNFTGFKQKAGGNEITFDPLYAFWYAHQMEDGNQYGRSVLRPAYKPYYFSELIHLFANRYYERFGEPIVLGTAPTGKTVKDKHGNAVEAIDAMQALVEGLKSHSSVTIPSDFYEDADMRKIAPMFGIKYLESGMRGFDFTNYLNRLDMEKARAIFIPDLMLGTGRVGSYELGREHKRTFLTGLMGVFDDITGYIQRYIVDPVIRINFGEKTEAPKFTYMPLTDLEQDNLLSIIQAAVRADPTVVDIAELASKLGVPIKTAEELAEKTGSDVGKNQPPPGGTLAKDPQLVYYHLQRIKNYLEPVWDGEDYSPAFKRNFVEKTKIGFVEHHPDKEAYALIQGVVKDTLLRSFDLGKPLSEALGEVERVLRDREKKRISLDEREKSLNDKEKEGYREGRLLNQALQDLKEEKTYLGKGREEVGKEKRLLMKEKEALEKSKQTVEKEKEQLRELRNKLKEVDGQTRSNQGN